MDAETFVKICGLLNMPAPEVAKESGCSLPAVKAARSGVRPVSPKLEKFVTEKLRAASGDAAVKLVLETCMTNTLQIVGRLFRPVRLTEKADTLYQHEGSSVILSEYAGHVLSAATSDGWVVKLLLDGEQLPEIEINLEYAGDSEEMSDEDWESWCDNSMPREDQLEVVEAYMRQAFSIVIRDMASESYTTWPKLYEYLTEKLS